MSLTSGERWAAPRTAAPAVVGIANRVKRRRSFGGRWGRRSSRPHLPATPQEGGRHHPRPVGMPPRERRSPRVRGALPRSLRTDRRWPVPLPAASSLPDARAPANSHGELAANVPCPRLRQGRRPGNSQGNLLPTFRLSVSPFPETWDAEASPRDQGRRTCEDLTISWRRQILQSEAESQRIAVRKLLNRLQHPGWYVSRLQTIRCGYTACGGYGHLGG